MAILVVDASQRLFHCSLLQSAAPIRANI
jgi:hypothetical protein